MNRPTRPPLTIADLVRDWWVVLLAVPLALGAWAAFLYVGLRLQRLRWLAYVPPYLAAAYVIYEIVQTPQSRLSLFAQVLGTVGAVALWAVAAVHGLHVRREFAYRMKLRRLADDLTTERRVAIDMARNQPKLARTVGIGRPDIPGAEHANLVDVNSAPAGVIARLPGLDDAMAQRIVELRPYSSVEDLGNLFDLPARDVDELHDRTIFISM